MNTLPPIGTRVVYKKDNFWCNGGSHVGTVVHHWPQYNYKFDDYDEDAIKVKSTKPENEWKVSVELDNPPKGFPYKNKRVAAELADIELL